MRVSILVIFMVAKDRPSCGRAYRKSRQPASRRYPVAAGPKRLHFCRAFLRLTLESFYAPLRPSSVHSLLGALIAGVHLRGGAVGARPERCGPRALEVQPLAV